MAILSNEKVLTLDYWKRASHLQVGDYVFNKDGKLVKVKLVQEYRSEDCYEVMFDDYLTVSGDKHLAFALETPKYRKRIHEYKGIQRFRRPLARMYADDLLERGLKDARSRHLYSLPTTKPLEFPAQDLPVPPFLFGFWFFNRRANKAMAAPRGKATEIHQKFKDHGYKIVLGAKVPTGEQEFRVSPSIESQLAPHIPTKIPNNYLLASPTQRLELLQGIMHAKSRQYSPTRDIFRFAAFNYPTITMLQGLVESLGCRTNTKHDEYYNNYTLFFKTHHRLVENQVSPPVKVHHARRFITSITPIAAQLCVHIETEDADNTILVGEGFIQTC